MCGKYASQSNDINAESAVVAAQQPAYTVDPSHPLADASSSTELLGDLPGAVAEELRSKARVLSDVLLIHMFSVVTDPAFRIAAFLRRGPQYAATLPFITAAIDEEITNRYLTGTLALPFVHGGEETVNYLESPAAKVEIEAFRAAQRAQAERGNAMLN